MANWAIQNDVRINFGGISTVKWEIFRTMIPIVIWSYPLLVLKVVEFCMKSQYTFGDSQFGSYVLTNTKSN